MEKFCRDVPTILFDNNMDDIGEAFVGLGNFQSVGMIIEYLCRTGEAPCFFDMRHPSNPNANKRRESYIFTMERLGFEPRIIRAEGEGWNFEEIGRAEGTRVLAERLLTTDTVLCSNDRLAIGFLTACYENGLRVERGQSCALRVAGHDDHPFSRYTCPPLTTVAQDYQSISNRNVEALFAVVEGDRPKVHTQTLFRGRCSAEIGMSCAWSSERSSLSSWPMLCSISPSLSRSRRN